MTIQQNKQKSPHQNLETSNNDKIGKIDKIDNMDNFDNDICYTIKNQNPYFVSFEPKPQVDKKFEFSWPFVVNQISRLLGKNVTN